MAEFEIERGMDVRADPDTPEGRDLIETLETNGIAEGSYLHVHTVEEPGDFVI